MTELYIIGISKEHVKTISITKQIIVGLFNDARAN